MLTALPPTRWPTASEEAKAATSATAAATRNNEQKIRRHEAPPLRLRRSRRLNGDVDSFGFLVIGLRVRLNDWPRVNAGTTLLAKARYRVNIFSEILFAAA